MSFEEIQETGVQVDAPLPSGWNCSGPIPPEWETGQDWFRLDAPQVLAEFEVGTPDDDVRDLLASYNVEASDIDQAIDYLRIHKLVREA